MSRLLNQGPLPLREQRALKTRSYGQIARSGYRIEKITYESEPGILIPALLFVPEGNRHESRPSCMLTGAASRRKRDPDRIWSNWQKLGLSCSRLMPGEWARPRFWRSEQASDVRPYFGDYDSAMTALVVGKPLVGMRALDISRAVDLLQAREDVDPDHILAFGRGNGAVSVLYAATLDERLKKIVLERMLVSYQTIVDQKIHRQVFESVVPSVLRFYDLPDLVAALAPREVWMVNPVDAVGHVVRSQQAESNYTFAQQAFRLTGQPNRLHFRNRGTETILQAYPELR